MSGSLSTKEKGKKMAQNFLYKLADSFDVKKPEAPPKPPSKSSQSDHSQISHVPEDITAMFNNLTVSSSSEYDRMSSAAPFVGGFRPIVQGSFYKPNHASVNSLSAPDLPMPLGMASPYADRPQSLTMQMALRPEQSVPQVNRIHSNPLPSFNLTEEAKLWGPEPLKPISTVGSHASVSAPIKSNKSEVSSTISTPSRRVGHVRCSGITKAGKRCNRTVKAKASVPVHALEDDNETNQQFCYQHTKELLVPTGFYARKNREWVKFEDWIPPYLQPETQVSLRIEMERARSQSDVPGYIYTFEIREKHEKETIKLKVGRAVNLVKRIDEWGKQCGSKEQILRGYFPFPDRDGDGHGSSLMKGRIRAGEKGPWCHRLERLVHLELGDLASSSIYLNSGWPNLEPIMEPSAENKPSASKNLSNSNPIATPCSDCGSVHKEIFEFQRWQRGGNQGKEWENLVRPVIERWGMFVELYV